MSPSPRRLRVLGAGVVGLLLVAAAVTVSLTRAEPPVAGAAESGVVLDVISDVQGDLPDLEHALAGLHEAGPADALVVVGDLVQTGAVEEYEAFRDVLDGGPTPDRTLFAIGNHEYMTGEPAEVLTDRFLEYTGMPAPYSRTDVGDVPVIVLGSLTAPDDEVLARLGPEQLDWFDRELDRAAAGPGPVLVFAHHPLPDTVSNTGVARGNDRRAQYPPEEQDRLLQILGEHPDAVLFTGHTHRDLRYDDWAVRREVPGGHPDGFTAVNTGAVQTPWFFTPDGEEVPGSPEEFNQGLRVRVAGDSVDIEAHDFRTGEIVNRLEVDAG
ncbi:DUF4073 domain-containing protein [Pseudonocardia nematodicida]|uniref:DUF4073 domain-containing protein n=1 Tax=Pseudonocardia nematodicida TaxID=1206997 RepID=A0ABV1KDD0_9PSEU